VAANSSVAFLKYRIVPLILTDSNNNLLNAATGTLKVTLTASDAKCIDTETADPLLLTSETQNVVLNDAIEKNTVVNYFKANGSVISEASQVVLPPGETLYLSFVIEQFSNDGVPLARGRTTDRLYLEKANVTTDSGVYPDATANNTCARLRGCRRESTKPETPDDIGCTRSKGAFKFRRRRDRLACPEHEPINYNRIFRAKPRRGNALVLLTQQYAAALLNGLCNSTAAAPNATDAELIADALDFIKTNKEKDLTARGGEDELRQQALTLNEQLAAYNDGLRSVPECASEEDDQDDEDEGGESGDNEDDEQEEEEEEEDEDEDGQEERKRHRCVRAWIHYKRGIGSCVRNQRWKDPEICGYSASTLLRTKAKGRDAFILMVHQLLSAIANVDCNGADAGDDDSELLESALTYANSICSLDLRGRGRLHRWARFRAARFALKLANFNEGKRSVRACRWLARVQDNAADASAGPPGDTRQHVYTDSSDDDNDNDNDNDNGAKGESSIKESDAQQEHSERAMIYSILDEGDDDDEGQDYDAPDKSSDQGQNSSGSNRNTYAVFLQGAAACILLILLARI